jgi:hypothetical protein
VPRPALPVECLDANKTTSPVITLGTDVSKSPKITLLVAPLENPPTQAPRVDGPGSAPLVYPVSPLSQDTCVPTTDYSIAMLFSNGTDTLCYQTTSFGFYSLAFINFGLELESGGREDETPNLPTDGVDGPLVLAKLEEYDEATFDNWDSSEAKSNTQLGSAAASPTEDDEISAATSEEDSEPQSQDGNLGALWLLAGVPVIGGLAWWLLARRRRD